MQAAAIAAPGVQRRLVILYRQFAVDKVANDIVAPDLQFDLYPAITHRTRHHRIDAVLRVQIVLEFDMGARRAEIARGTPLSFASPQQLRFQ